MIIHKTANGRSEVQSVRIVEICKSAPNIDIEIIFAGVTVALHIFTDAVESIVQAEGGQGNVCRRIYPVVLRALKGEEVANFD